ncbi:T9SS type A sorting domain-containing protein [Hymenobacter sp. RP-2-7]|uniref:T9SS type A sorting domain-containing protein n=1 Tax=Hymenobacter polaris TaxID=2682546 RepID=A0A7Y0FMP3_9BACT|nr:M36 family metallopeptidase [Hymenobacter polaris]NML65731.1 T9SS type A sorting domain-containing protein [Hymenobacter polaris]
MSNKFTRSGYWLLAVAAALVAPGRALAQQPKPVAPGALATFATRAQAQGLTAADVSNSLVTDSYTDANGLTHTYLQQRVNGLVVFNATGAVHTNAAGKVVLTTQAFVAGAAAKAAPPAPALSPEQAVVATSVALGLPRPVGLRTLVDARVADGLTFNNGGISAENIPVQLLYEAVDGQLVLVWSVAIATLDEQHYWNAHVDAQTGRLVSKTDYVVSEATTFRQHTTAAVARQQRALAYNLAALPAPAPAPLGVTAARSLTVVPVPYENPAVHPREVVPLSVANPLYSPYGWQVAEGKAPSGFFADSYSLLSSGKYLTRGNNVAAYDDYGNTASTSPNLASPTSSPDGTSALNFDFPFDQTLGARNANNLAAGITNLFYWSNMLHDVLMAHGFDEASGNYQYKNITGQGLGNDFLRAESQDGSGRNNANFLPTPDGVSGRMQMYLFDNVPANALTVTGASAVAGTYQFAAVAFGPTLTKKPLAGKLVLVNDGVSADNGDHGCATPFVNASDVSGNVAFIQRGGCPQLTGLNPRANNQFAPKVKRAQANGASAVIVFDSLATTNLVSFGGTDTVGIRIPAIFISGADGFKLRAAIRAGATLNVSAALGPDIDGSFDNGVVSHEFGHGVSTRLTGGPANPGCLPGTTGNQIGGEGWSDFFSLWMTTHAGDIGSTPRYVATYDNSQSFSVGPGFRNQPYTTDITKNTYTYAQLGTATGKYSETHDVGEVWCTVLWDLNWQFIYKYGYNADFFSATGGNNKLLKLVLDGCKLQVCNPGFLDSRDALLRADTLTNGAANADLIWAVFARRGMGYSAKQGDKSGSGVPQVTGIVQAFDVSPTAKAITLATRNGVVSGSALEAFPNPAQDRLTVRTQLGSAAPMEVTLLNLLGQAVLPAATVPAAQMQQAGYELRTGSLAPGLYVVRVRTSGGTYTTKVTIER